MAVRLCSVWQQDGSGFSCHLSPECGTHTASKPWRFVERNVCWPVVQTIAATTIRTRTTDGGTLPGQRHQLALVGSKYRGIRCLICLAFEPHLRPSCTSVRS